MTLSMWKDLLDLQEEVKEHKVKQLKEKSYLFSNIVCNE